MKTQLLVCLLSLLLIGFATAAKSKSKEKSVEAEKEATKRVETIGKLSLQRPLVTLTDKNYSKFVSERPRNYHAAVLFTATDPKYACEACVSAKDALAEIADLYNNQYDFNESEIENRVAFFILEVDDSRSAFQSLELQTVPRFYILPSRTLDDPKQSMQSFEVDGRVILGGPTNIIMAIEKVTNVKIELTTKSGPYLVVLVALSVVMAFFVSLASQDVYKAVFWYQNRLLWTIVSLICFSVGVSGSIFCYIKSAPYYGFGRQGIRIFAGQGRDQFFIEGIIIAALTVGSAIAMTFAYYITKLRMPLLRHIGVILAMSIFTVVALEIFSAYSEKTRWYQVKETFPPEVWSFLTASVKKSSQLPKRLLRLSEIWLFEYKDWDGFTRKAKQLVLDYIVRVFGAEKLFRSSEL